MRFLALIALLGTATTAQATSFMPVPFPNTVEGTPTIVRGRAGSSYSDYGAARDGSRRIYTFTNLTVEEVFKGDAPGASLVFRELGGTKDGVGMMVAGAAQFSNGEDVVVTLGPRNDDGTYDLRGLSTGKYAVQKDADGTEYLVGMGLNMNGEGIVHDEDVPTSDKKRWTLTALRQLVKDQKDHPSLLAATSGAPASPARLSAQRDTIQPSASRKQALQLQPDTAEGWLGISRLLWIAAAGLLALIFVIIRALIFRRK
jgi:hypothetical protein